VRRLALVAALLLVAAACTGDDDDSTSTTRSPSTATIPAGVPGPAAEVVALDNIELTLTEVGRATEPTSFAVRAGTDGFYVGEKAGHVLHIASPNDEPVEVLDISDDVASDSLEQGLLGIAFSADGDLLYVSYTNVDGDTRIDEVDLGTGERRSVFSLDQPYGNHNGGHIVFGPDGLLWLGLGDGGGAGDPEDRAQDPDELLGKIIRFDPASPRPEVWALGVRNPWRFSFDRANGDVWIGDVGQGDWEEIDHVPATVPVPVNLGWNLLEGSHPFDADEAPGTTMPVFEYGHDEGQSVIGGFVYRSAEHAALHGVYVFTDAYQSDLRLLRRTVDGVEHRRTDVEVPGGSVSSFGEDADGELYVLSLSGGVYRLGA
jgi:glucose/arabinose dehydrogenase